MRWVAAGTLVLGAACSHQSRPPANIIDELSRSEGRPETPASGGTAVATYRLIVRPVLGSQCPWLPSDSEFLVRSIRNCGAVAATYRAFGRLLEEPDISALPVPLTNDGGRLRWFSGDLRCDE